MRGSAEKWRLGSWMQRWLPGRVVPMRGKPTGEERSLHLDAPEFFSRLESDTLALRDVHAGSGLDVPPLAGFAGPGFEDAEPSDLDAVSIQEGLLHPLRKQINHLQGRGFGHGQGLHQGGGDIDLDHDCLGLWGGN